MGKRKAMFAGCLAFSVLLTATGCSTGPSIEDTLIALDRQYDRLLVEWQEAQDGCGDDKDLLAQTNRAYLEQLHAVLACRLSVLTDAWQDARDARGLDPASGRRDPDGVVGGLNVRDADTGDGTNARPTKPEF